MTSVNPPTGKRQGDRQTGVVVASAKPPSSLFGGLTSYLKGVRGEWGKITWPTWPQLWGQTMVVVFMVTFMSIGLWIIDNTFRFLVGLITPHA